jgi:hypothetical protein
VLWRKNGACFMKNAKQAGEIFMSLYAKKQKIAEK